MPKGYKAGGRQKGSLNKKTKEEIQRIEKVLALLEETQDDDLTELSAYERVKLWQDLQEYIRPKLARTELTGKDGGAIDLSLLTPDELKSLKALQEKIGSGD